MSFFYLDIHLEGSGLLCCLMLVDDNDDDDDGIYRSSRDVLLNGVPLYNHRTVVKNRARVTSSDVRPLGEMQPLL